MGDAMLIIIMLLLVVGGWWCHSYESYHWNGGYSRLTGTKWVRFTVDSQGGRGYKDAEGNFLWVTWYADRDYEEPNGQSK